MLAFTLIRSGARTTGGPTLVGHRPPLRWGHGPRQLRRARKTPRANGKAAIRPSSPGNGVFHRQRTALLLKRAATRSCTSHLTVELSEAAFELLASRLVPTA